MIVVIRFSGNPNEASVDRQIVEALRNPAVSEIACPGRAVMVLAQRYRAQLVAVEGVGGGVEVRLARPGEEEEGLSGVQDQVQDQDQVQEGEGE